MSTSTVPLLLLVVTLAHSAPLGTPQTSDWTQILVRSQSLVQKILQSLVQIHAQIVTSPGLTFDHSGHAPELHLMMSQLQIPTPPVLKPLSPSFTQEDCVRRMWEGLEQQQRIVGELSSKQSTLSDLHADLSDLKGQVATMMSAMGVVNSSPVQSESSILINLHGDYETEVAVHLMLTTLRTFCQDLRRSLRTLESQPV
ncbi:hypothetical protein NQD34_005909 [Periophthalmus magnuspinnatus]|nr:hypothetical protein NQD34_005909 [Periophthalmus magnuspinnatus]